MYPFILNISRFSLLMLFLFASIFVQTPMAEELTYKTLLQEFQNPDHAKYGEVPLWWWEGAPMSKERVTWQLETLAEQGVKAVCPIQRSPGRCDPQSFDPEWWDMLKYANEECKRLGMKLWAYDQIGYGHYGWLEKASAQTQDESTYKLDFKATDIKPGETYEQTLPQGKLILARAYPIEDGIAIDDNSQDLREAIEENQLTWNPGDREWRVVTIVAKPQYTFYLSDAASDTFLSMLYGKIERTLGEDSMGESFEGVFQDEHPPTPTDHYTEELADLFQQRCGYDIGRAIPALHFDVGAKTPKYRTDFYDVYLELVEKTYWKKVYDWTEERNLLTSHDNWGRNNIYTQSRGYLDYFRTQRWFSAPGYDDSGQRAVRDRNYYDAKIASSIARLYNRPRVWNEAFHSSGWGRTTDQTLSWLSAGMAFGANLYDEHGLYYSTNASTWEHAAPDPHWRQPYWHYYDTLSDWVTRTSYLMSQGQQVVDAAVHYPVVSLLADGSHDQSEIDYNLYMRLSKTLFDAEIDNDIADDDSILAAEIRGEKLWMGGNGYRALVFGPERTMRRSVLEKASQFAKQGGIVVFYERLPEASAEAGREDQAIQDLWMNMLGLSKTIIEEAEEPILHRVQNGGLIAYVPSGQNHLPTLISQTIDRDFQSQEGGVYYTHRQVGDTHIYLVQNIKEERNDFQARFRVDGVPELWDPFTGEIQPVDQFERKDGYTYVTHRLEGNVAVFFIFKPGDEESAKNQVDRIQPEGKELDNQWEFSVIPTRDNVWGEFRWPPSEEKMGPEVRSFKYHEETQKDAPSDWNKPEFNDQGWSQKTYSMGPYWLLLGPLSTDQELTHSQITGFQPHAGAVDQFKGEEHGWETIEFSKNIGLAKAVPWGGHSGYPDGHIDRTFVELPEGRKLLFTRIHSPEEQRVGLCVELRNSNARLWVNGKEQPFEGAVGNLPLQKGENEILLDLPDGSGGKLYVQEEPPTIQTMSEAAQHGITPDLREANWIWVDEAQACYLRKTFELEEIPQTAQVIVTAFSGYRLFVNGVKLEEEIGPWARWTHPETFNITPFLREGENVIALWGQLYFGQHVNRDAINHRGALFAMKAREPNGEEWSIVTDSTWKGMDQEEDGWESPGFDDSDWPRVVVRAKMGDQPWGDRPLENISTVSEPKRPLSVNLSSPYLECFDEVPEIIYDIKPKEDKRIGWYRFEAPPGLHQMQLHTDADVQVWVDGEPVEVEEGVVTVPHPPASVSQVAIRLEMKQGEYGGAAFPQPIGLKLQGGKIGLGDWQDYAMPTYSGIGVYKQTVRFTEEELQNKTLLELGEVKVAAEVLVNGQSAGVRLARPFRFDLSPHLVQGENTIEVRVANTIAPHYTTIPALHIGPTESGLFGPVKLQQVLPESKWINWAREEIEQLEERLNTTTPELRRQQRQWEKSAPWLTLESTTKSQDNAAKQRRSTYDVGEYAHPITGLCFHLSTDKNQPSAEINDLKVTYKPKEKTPVRGRYVRVEIPERSEYLSLAEVQVFQNEKNIALEGEARQSKTSAGGVAQRAIDGNTDGRYFESESVTHTPQHHHPWWELDLGEENEIDEIVLWNRTDREQDEILRLHDFTVIVLDGERNQVWGTRVEEAPEPNVRFSFSGPRSLSLNHLQVWQEHEKVETKTHRKNQHDDIRFSPTSGKSVQLMAQVEGGLQVKPGQITIAIQSEDCTLDNLSLTQSSTPWAAIPKPINDLLKQKPEERSPEQKHKIAKFYRSITPLFDEERTRLNTLKEQLNYTLNE